jgi:uncharacterized protein GlcG (DUF336 family)
MTSFLTTKETLSLDDARRVIAAGEEAAHTLGLPMLFTVLDSSGDLVAQARMDGTWLPGTGQGADCGLFRRAVELAATALAQNSDQVRHFVSISHSDSTRLTILVAAVALRSRSRAVGAVAVSGLGGEHDSAVAIAAARAFR